MGETHLPRLYEELSGLAFRRAAKFSESRMTCNEETKWLPWLLLECDLRLWNRLLLHFTVSSLVQWNFGHVCMTGWSKSAGPPFPFNLGLPIPWTVFSRSYYILVMRSFVTCHGGSFRDADLQRVVGKNRRLEGIAFAADPDFNMPTSQLFWPNMAVFLSGADVYFAEIFLGPTNKVAGDFWTFPFFLFWKKSTPITWNLQKWILKMVRRCFLYSRGVFWGVCLSWKVYDLITLCLP